jgi:hypothetical protein
LLEGDSFDTDVVIVGFYQLMFGFAAAIFLFHSALSASTVTFVSITHTRYSAHAVMNVYYYATGKGNVHDREQ